MRLGAAVAGLLLVVAQAAGESADERLLAGLRARGLYELAERFCADRLAGDDLSPRRRAKLTAELSRTLAEWATASSGEHRGTRTQQAARILDEYLADHRDAPPSVFVQYQRALNHLAFGELLRQEAELGNPDDDTRFTAARDRLRAAARELETLQTRLAAMLREQGIRATRSGEGEARLDEEELAALGRDVQFQLARARRNQAASYPPASADRIHALNEAIDALTPLARLDTTHRLSWPSRLALARAHRLLGDHDTAARMLNAIDAADPPPDVALRARAERIQLALDDRDTPGAATERAVSLIQRGREIDGITSPRLDLAWLDTFLAAWRDAAARDDHQAARQWQDRATAMEQTIAQAHGPYWRHRAGLLLAEQVRRVPPAASEDVVLLIEAADDLYRGGRLDDALAGYDRAAEAAAGEGDRATAFSAAYKAAAIEHRRGNQAEAARRFRHAALTLSNHPRAREAHRLAIYHAAQIVDASTDARPAALADYAVLLREHLQRWPSSDEADRFRLQLGRIERAEGRFADAVRALSDISRDSTRYDDALVELRKCFGEASIDQWDDLPPAPVLADLATRYPDDGAIQEAHARALANSEPPEAWRRALEQFRAIEKRSPEGSARWFRAKYGIASMHLRLGDAAKAAKMVRLLKVLHPELGGPELRPQFEELLRRHGDAGEQ